jgi:CRP/FNR family transcriptional regulator, cyclic AMP receptor protein
VGNPFISQALVREHTRDLERQASASRKAHQQVTDHLAAVGLFANCGKKELRAIAKQAKIVTIHSGTQIITEGEDGNTMYVILDGTARVARNGRRLATIGTGDSFGELALLTKGPRTATVVATSDIEAAVISRRQLNGLLEDAPAFARKLLEALAGIVRDLDKKVV